VIDQLLTVEFWQSLPGVALRAWAIIIPLLLIAGYVGWTIKGWLDGREIRGLRAEINTADRQLKLAQDEQKAVTAPVEILNNTKLEDDVAALTTKVAQIESLIPQSLFSQLNNQLVRVASTTAVVTSTARELSEANTALGITLSPPSASLTLTSEPPSVTLSSEGRDPHAPISRGFPSRDR
jgi:hypothetical protein